MSSLQEPAAGSKSAKFVAANPLEPMVKPFEEGLNDDQKDIQRALAENVNDRLTKAMDELKEKHREGTNEIDDPDRAPTGHAYRLIQERQQAAARDHERMKRIEEEQKRQEEATSFQALRRNAQNQLNDEDEDDDSDYDDLLEDDDPVLDALRQQRMAEMKQAQKKKAEDLARGHGQYRTISQDEFLPECTSSSEFVAVLFFHKEFQRCNIMDHHLKIIAPLHTECKFLRIDAEKAPFFVTKLKVRTLPTLIVFRDGKAVDRLTGFEGLSKDPKDPDKWETSRLEAWLDSTGAIEYNPSADDLRDEMERLGVRPQTSIYRGGIGEYNEDSE